MDVADRIAPETLTVVEFSGQSPGQFATARFGCPVVHGAGLRARTSAGEWIELK